MAGKTATAALDDDVQEKDASVTPKKACYFFAGERYTYMLPDGEQFIVHQKLSEGQRKRIQDAPTVEQRQMPGSSETVLRYKQGTDRHNLLLTAIVDWNLFDAEANPIVFSDAALKRFLDNADPDIVDDIENDIRRHNKWLYLRGDKEQVMKEIERLQETLAAMEEEEAKN